MTYIKSRNIHIFGLVLLMAATLVMQSCSTAYPEMLYNSTATDTGTTDEITVIKPYLNNETLSYKFSTRGCGTLDNNYPVSLFDQLYMQSRFYVLAFRNTLQNSGELSTQASYASLMGTSGAKECLVSTELTAGTTTHRGKLAKPATLSGELQFLDNTTGTKTEELYWSNTYNHVGYNFYAYGIDDATVNSVTADDSHVNYDITIDGTQDIMAGVSRHLTSDNLAKMYPDLDIDVVNKILSYGDGGYSAYSAGYGVQPTIDLKHMLSRLRFLAILKDDSKNYDDNSPSIHVIAIRVKANSRVNVCVAARDTNDIKVTSSSEESTFTLHSTPTIVNNEVVRETTFNDSLQYNKVDTIGESIMVAPQSSYVMEVDYKQHIMTKYDPENPANNEHQDVIRTATIPLTTDDGKAFEPGVTYYVTLNIYGAQRIDATVDCTPWHDGGDTSIDVNKY